MADAHDHGYRAYLLGLPLEDNPHYKAFDDLSQEFFDWSAGWNDAEDSYYELCDQRESEE